MIAYLFPGQGSQAPGMGAGLARAHAVCRTTFEEADDALGFAISRLCFEGPAEALVLTANTQPAILTVSVAIDRLLAASGLRPALAAGHSLGEYSALVSAGVLGFGDALRAVRLRGAAMQEAVPEGRGAMAAILGLAPEIVEEVCRESTSAEEVVAAANFNSPEQTVIAGEAKAVARASALAVARGASRVVPLPVSAPFHCALMKPAETALAAHLQGVTFHDPRVPVVANVDAREIASGEAARGALIRQVCSPVRWTASIARLRELGAGQFFEVGPGKVLTTLMRRIDRALEANATDDVAGVESALRKAGVVSPTAAAEGGR